VRRILAAQAVQFPEPAKLAREEGWLRAVRGIASLLQRFAAGGEIKVEDPELAADLFLTLVLGAPDVSATTASRSTRTLRNGGDRLPSSCS
jgi:hypothetical protein